MVTLMVRTVRLVEVVVVEVVLKSVVRLTTVRNDKRVEVVVVREVVVVEVVVLVVIVEEIVVGSAEGSVTVTVVSLVDQLVNVSKLVTGMVISVETNSLTSGIVKKRVTVLVIVSEVVT